MPTRDQLSDATDFNGNRVPDIDETVLRGFIRDVATGLYGDSKGLVSWEIGNEYWGSGRMNAVEYGRVASEMVVIIQDEMRSITEERGDFKEYLGALVQIGNNYGDYNLETEYDGLLSVDVIDDLLAKHPQADISYENIRDSGVVNWTEVTNELIIMAFDTPKESDDLKGLAAALLHKSG